MIDVSHISSLNQWAKRPNIFRTISNKIGNCEPLKKGRVEGYEGCELERRWRHKWRPDVARGRYHRAAGRERRIRHGGILHNKSINYNIFFHIKITNCSLFKKFIFLAHEYIKKLPKKVLIISPNLIFWAAYPVAAPKPAQTHKNCSPSDLCITRNNCFAGSLALCALSTDVISVASKILTFYPEVVEQLLWNTFFNKSTPSCLFWPPRGVFSL